MITILLFSILAGALIASFLEFLTYKQEVKTMKISHELCDEIRRTSRAIIVKKYENEAELDFKIDDYLISYKQSYGDLYRFISYGGHNNGGKISYINFMIPTRQAEENRRILQL